MGRSWGTSGRGILAMWPVTWATAHQELSTRGKGEIRGDMRRNLNIHLCQIALDRTRGRKDKRQKGQEAERVVREQWESNEKYCVRISGGMHQVSNPVEEWKSTSLQRWTTEGLLSLGPLRHCPAPESPGGCNKRHILTELEVESKAACPASPHTGELWLVSGPHLWGPSPQKGNNHWSGKALGSDSAT